LKGNAACGSGSGGTPGGGDRGARGGTGGAWDAGGGEPTACRADDAVTDAPGVRCPCAPAALPPPLNVLSNAVTSRRKAPERAAATLARPFTTALRLPAPLSPLALPLPPAAGMRPTYTTAARTSIRRICAIWILCPGILGWGVLPRVRGPCRRPTQFILLFSVYHLALSGTANFHSPFLSAWWSARRFLPTCPLFLPATANPQGQQRTGQGPCLTARRR